MSFASLTTTEIQAQAENCGRMTTGQEPRPSDAELNAAWMDVHHAYSDAEEADRAARQAWAVFVEKRAVAVRLLGGAR